MGLSDGQAYEGENFHTKPDYEQKAIDKLKMLALVEDVSEKKAVVDTGAKKNDALDCKVRLDLMPPAAMFGISTVFTYGAAKYDDWNWAKGLQYSRLYGALQRHLLLWYMGQNVDPETGFSHLWHAGCNIAMLIHTEMVHDTTANNKGLDDRPSTFHSITMQNKWLSILKNSESYQAVSKRP